MGCVASRIDKEERVQICKERKRLMKQLVRFRGEFANAQVVYLRALKNTGVTLRQFTESESLELENISYGLALPPSPPLPLPPSPPPPPFSPDIKKSSHIQKEGIDHEYSTGIDDYDHIPPQNLIPSSSWNIWEGFEPSLEEHMEKSEIVEPLVEEENWAETKTEFEEEDREEMVGNAVNESLYRKQQQPPPPPPVKLVDDNSSMMSWDTKDTADMAMVEWRSKKTLEGIVKDLDDYFLKASAGVKEIAVLMDISKDNISLAQSWNENKRKRSNSAKVFSALSWSWSSKPLQLARDATEICSPDEPCKPGAHRSTLDKLYYAEQKLYKELKAEEIAKLEYDKKSMLLLRQEEENLDWMKTDKTRVTVEELETDIRRLQDSISRTCSFILEVIDVELYPQLLALTSGLKHMWRTICECHQIQNHISQQLNHLTDNLTINLTTEYHRQASAQLETEVNSWYHSFCRLLQSQKEYVRTLYRWVELTNCLKDDQHRSSYSSVVRNLCKEWQLVFDRLPDKVASDAIRCLLTAIQLIMRQQEEEYNLHKKSDKLEKRLQKELLSLTDLETKLDWSFAAGDTPATSKLSPKHPLSQKHAKVEDLKKIVEIEKNKYLNSVQDTKVMTLNSLKTSLPNVFQALSGFSCAFAKAFETVHNKGKEAVDYAASENPMS